MKKKKGKAAYCLHYLTTESSCQIPGHPEFALLGCDEVHLRALFYLIKIPVWRDGAAAWGLIRPTLEDIRFEWIHYSELFYLFNCMAAF